MTSTEIKALHAVVLHRTQRFTSPAVGVANPRFNFSANVITTSQSQDPISVELRGKTIRGER